MNKTLFIFPFLIFISLFCSAQMYVVDDLYGDSVMVNQIEMSTDKTTEIPGKPAFYLQSGDTVTVTRLLKGNHYPAITIDGKEYTINEGNLIFLNDNPEGTVDIWADAEWNQNREIKKFFATFTPYGFIAVFFIVAMAFAFLGLKVNSVRNSAMYFVPICILLASVLEIWAYIVLGNEAFWWCDKSRYGFWGSLFRALPFVIFVAFQIFSFKLYSWLLVGKDSDKELSIKPLAISLGICIPVTVAVIIILTLLGQKGTLRDVLSIVAFLLSLGGGLGISMNKNIKILGKKAGGAFTLFGIVYIIGSLIAIWGLLIVLVRLIVQILLICAAIVGVGFAMSTGSSAGEVWTDSEGRARKSPEAANYANHRIAERKSAD